MAYEPKRPGCGQASVGVPITTGNLTGEMAGPSTESKLASIDEAIDRLNSLLAELGARISPALLPVQANPNPPAVPVDNGHNSPLNDRLRVLEHRIVWAGDEVRLLTSRCCL